MGPWHVAAAEGSGSSLAFAILLERIVTHLYPAYWRMEKASPCPSFQIPF